MEEKQHVQPHSDRLTRLTTAWRACDKKKWAKIGGVAVTIGTLVVFGLRKGVPWDLTHK